MPIRSPDRQPWAIFERAYVCVRVYTYTSRVLSAGTARRPSVDRGSPEQVAIGIPSWSTKLDLVYRFFILTRREITGVIKRGKKKR